MATATINGITFDGLSTADVIEIATRFAPKPVSHTAVEKVIEAVSEKPNKVQANDPQGTHTYECGHTLPASRGRYSALCRDCKSGNTEKPKAKAEKGAERNSEGGKKGKREFDAEKFAKWMEQHGDEPMLGKWERRIRYMLTDRNVSAKKVREIEAFLDSSPRPTNQAAHAKMGELYKIERRQS